MFTDPLSWQVLLQAALCLSAGAAAWAAGRRLRLTLSPAARAARQELAELHAVAGELGFTVDEPTRQLLGRAGGWPVAVEPGSSSESWQIRLHGRPPTGRASRQLPPPLDGLPPARIDGEHICVELSHSHARDDLPRVLSWLADVAHHVHEAPALPSTHPDSGVAASCSALGLRADGTLPRWEGEWEGRPLAIELLRAQAQVQVRLSLRVFLPGRLRVEGRASAGPIAAGSPIELPPGVHAARLRATASPSEAASCREILQDPALLVLLAEQLADGRGSRIASDELVLVRPATLWTVAPTRILGPARATANALEAAAEAPWRALCTLLPLTTSSLRQGGLPVLEGRVDDFVLRVHRSPTRDGVELTAEAPTSLLAPGLSITARGPTDPPGLRTGNLILDQQACVALADPSSVPSHRLAALPVDALLPLLHETPRCRIDETGARVCLPGFPSHEHIVTVASDLIRLLPALPRRPRDEAGST